MTYEERWQYNYELAKEYYETYNNLLIPQNYVAIDEDNNEINLGSWINKQRKNYKKGILSTTRINLLNEIGMVWSIYNNCEIISDEWMEKYEFAKEYYEKHKNLFIPQNYIIRDKNNSEVKLGEWIHNQRQRKKEGTLNKKQIKLLNEIKMVWSIYNNCEIISDEWMEKYEFAKEYYEKHKNLLIPQNYIVVDENNKEVKLGEWIRNQRHRKKEGTLNKKQIKLLNKIKMVWKVHGNKKIISDKWMKNYELAKSYYDEHNNLLIPSTYVVKDEDGEEVKLGNWINIQRRAYKGDKNRSLTEKQICLLDEIDMVYNVRYYKTLVKQLDMEYNLYQYGLLDNKNVEELVDNKHLIFEDSNKIIKGNAIVLSKKLVA